MLNVPDFGLSRGTASGADGLAAVANAANRGQTEVRNRNCLVLG